MIWNTQHLNNQNQARPMSKAYTEKKELLDLLITNHSPDIIALFKVGNTGAPNTTLVADLSNKYTLVGQLDPEGGSSKYTTLGSLVFAKNELAGDFSAPDFQTVLGSEHRRASIVIKHVGTGNHFAFYHANASGKAWRHIKEEIDHLQDQFGQEQHSWLAFFGGDLNANEAPAKTTDPRYGRSMIRQLPAGPGYTHVSLQDSEDVAYARYLFEAKNSIGQPLDKKTYLDSYMGSELEYGIVPRLSMLDYAYVADHVKCIAECNASVQGTRDWTFDSSASATLSSQNQFQQKPFSSVEKRYDGKLVRSDHFPVFYSLDL
jgi:hypothetical protein